MSQLPNVDELNSSKNNNSANQVSESSMLTTGAWTDIGVGHSSVVRPEPDDED